MGITASNPINSWRKTELIQEHFTGAGKCQHYLKEKENTDVRTEKETHVVLFDLTSYNCYHSENHSKHYSISALQIDNLPENCRTDEMLEVIKLSSNAVVLICVSYTSNIRKKDGKYALSDSFKAAAGVRRYGTGWACLPPDNVEGDIQCPLENCKFAEQPHRVNASIRIITARHMIFNNVEAKNTEVTFFYDSPDTDNVIVAQGVRLSIINSDRDFVVLECVTHDDTLKDKLAQVLNKLSNINLTYESFLRNNDENDEETIALIISHPHGGPKHVTYGHCLNIEEHDTEFNMNGEKKKAMCVYTYNTATCPGSSGAPVIILGHPGVKYYWTPHRYIDGNGNGVSSKGLVQWTDFEFKDETRTFPKVL